MKAKRRARERGVVREVVRPEVVFERDRWRCGLCGEKVKKDAVVPHSRAPTLDHIVPLAELGPHTYANVQCAHFECNWKKRDGGSQQLKMFG